MSRFTVQLTRAAVKDLDAVPQVHRRHLATDLRALADLGASWPAGIKRIKGFGFPLYRLRAGDYRVLFRIDDTLVTIMRVINRKYLDRTLRRIRGR